MNRQELFTWALAEYGTVPDYPWDDSNAVLRHADNRKWYALFMEVKRKSLGLPGDGFTDVMNIKCSPLLIGSLRSQPGFFPAYHMNKEQWLTVSLESAHSEADIKGLLSMSFDLTKPNNRKK